MNISINILILRINQTIALAKLNSFFKNKNFFFFFAFIIFFKKNIGEILVRPNWNF